jgi:hypothetical protein
MVVRRAHKFKLRPTRAQEALFLQMSGNGRFVYNQLLAWAQEVYGTTGQNVIARQALCARITELKREHPFLKRSHVHTLQSKADDPIVAYSDVSVSIRRHSPPYRRQLHGRDAPRRVDWVCHLACC